MGTEANAVTVTLLKAHTHAGREYQPDQQIDVSLAEAKFLLNNKVIREIPQSEKAKAEK